MHNILVAWCVMQSSFKVTVYSNFFIMLLSEITSNPPPDDSTAREWQEWKNQALSTSMKIFLERHPWFSFKKQDIFQNLRERCSVPSIYAITQPGDKISSCVPRDLQMLVFKKTVGHSSKDVHVLRRLKDSETYECFLTKRKISNSDLQEWADTNECIVEQSLSSFQEVIPFDFKCYLVDGVVKYVGVFNRNATKTVLAYFDAQSLKQIPFADVFADVPNIWFEGFGPYSQEFLRRIILAKQEAERIANDVLNVSGIILSLDMYVIPSECGFKVWLGEITPRPGAIHSNWLRRSFVRNLFDFGN